MFAAKLKFGLKIASLECIFQSLLMNVVNVGEGSQCRWAGMCEGGWDEEQDVGDATRSQLGVFEEGIQKKNKYPKWKLEFCTSVTCEKKWVSACGCLNTAPNCKPKTLEYF